MARKLDEEEIVSCHVEEFDGRNVTIKCTDQDGNEHYADGEVNEVGQMRIEDGRNLLPAIKARDGVIKTELSEELEVNPLQIQIVDEQIVDGD